MEKPMTATKLLATSALALILGLGVAHAQSGGEARSNDRKIEKSLDSKELTPIRPIRRVGENNWPAATNPPQPHDNPPANPADDPQMQPARAETIGGAAADKSKATAQAPAAVAQTNAQQDLDKSKRTEGNFASIRLGTDANGRVAVNAEQERQILASLRHQRVKPIEANASVNIGMAAPRDIRLGAVSADIVAILPQFRGYSFFATHEALVIVAPSSQKVVAIVPAKLSATASSEPRQRSSAKPASKETTSRTALRPPVFEHGVTVGSAIPDEDVIVEPSPPAATVYRIVPAYPRYGYPGNFQREPHVRIYPPQRYAPGDVQ
jgi:hypothetical protein